jgi:tetraacyldisaccharide 4'-kinase
MVLKHYFSDVMSGKRRATWLETSLSALFRAGVQARHFAYGHGWLKQTRLPACVVSVGNVVVGGTGKTPLVEKLVCALQDVCRVAILTRGFRSQIEASGKSVRVASRGELFASPDVCGDEPFCLGQRTRCDVWVGRNRVRSGQMALAAGAECLVLDDGMQYLALAKDIQIGVVDGKDPLSSGWFLPRGRLRDLPSRLKDVDLVVANHITDAAALETLQKTLKEVTPAPVVAMQVQLQAIDAFRGQSVAVYCGIGRPERFIEALTAAGVHVVDVLTVLDHTRATEAELDAFANRCQKKGAERILCTMKDWVKLPEDTPLTPVDMRLEIFSGHEHWDALLKTIAERVRR